MAGKVIRICAIPGLAAVLIACASRPAWLQPENSPPGQETSGLAFKRVAAKEAPASLFAADGSSCLVSGNKFENAEIGERVLCSWRARAAADPE